MKKLKVIGVSVLFIAFAWTESIYSHSVNISKGGHPPLSSYQGKKMLIVTLPLQQNASADSFLYALDTLAVAHTSNLVVIAVPSYEDGYTPAQKSTLQQWYRSKLGSYIVITDGLYTRKTSGSQQHGLFRWLTDVTKNEGFDIDVSGDGYKFFVDGSGQLFSVLRPHTKMSSNAVQKTLQIQ